MIVMKKTKRMISTIYDTLHAADSDELEGIYKNWAKTMSMTLLI